MVLALIRRFFLLDHFILIFQATYAAILLTVLAVKAKNYAKTA